MEDPKAWKPRKAWHLHVKETGTQKPSRGKNGVQSHTPRWGVVRYHNGLVQALGHKEWNVLGSIWARA